MIEAKFRKILISTEQIRMIMFKVQEKMLVFEYSDNMFSLIFDNDKEFGDVELDVRGKFGIGDDVGFTDYGDRKTLKGEYVLE
jgi:hypothetical protein